jgi:hypothetical protein
MDAEAMSMEFPSVNIDAVHVGENGGRRVRRRFSEENRMDKDLKEALETIKDLRAALQLAQFELADISDEDVDKIMAESEALLRKHGERDDLMDDE